MIGSSLAARVHALCEQGSHRKMAVKRKWQQWRIVMATLFFLNGCEGAIVRSSSAIAHASLSVEKEKEMGRRLVLRIEKELDIIRDPTVLQYVDSIGERIVSQIGGTPYEINFYVVKSPDPNAFAIPGGHIFLASGLIIMAASEDEVAGVVSHEVAHIKARHIAQRIERAKKLSLAAMAGILAGVIIGGKATEVMMAGSVAAGQAMALKYSREDEAEADQLGFRYLTKAGYDGWGMVSFLRKLHRMSLLSPGTPPSYLSTHPGIEDRISYLMGRLREIPERALKENGKDLKRVQAKLFVEERGTQTAIKHFQSILKGKPNDLDGLYGLALAYKKMGRIDLAIGELERARHLSPQDGGIIRELGICYFLNGRLDDAVSILRESLVIHPGDILSLYYMGRVYQEKGNLEASLDTYLMAKEINPDIVDLYYSLAVIYAKRGDRCNSHRNFSTYFDKRGEVKNALNHLRKALRYCDEQAEIQEEIRRLERALKEETKEM
ncbi:MAG: M48 family metalloprotease [Syntrophobacterales bacterium]|nr:MAG: M48 family metalloprotease [Syntrophobacterales bacterium]